MPNILDISSLPFVLLAGTTIIVGICGAIGYICYIIAPNRVKQPLVVFLARYGIGFLLLVFLELALLDLWPSFHATMRSLTATLVGGILTLAGVSHSVSGSTIMMQNPNLAFNVDSACLGYLLFWIYAALVLAESNASRKQRIAGILIGLGILVVFNFSRITLSVYLEWLTGAHVHDYFYLFNIVFVVLLWAGWLRTLKPKRPKFAKSTA
jgi:exosortase/archaeosortase family protein